MLKYDRQIYISTAGSRKAKYWPAQKLTYSDLVKKLETPTRSTETLSQYLALSKSKQDDLKDIGGFVGGLLKGGRRKAENVQSRDFLALDLDNIPAGLTEATLTKINAFNCGGCIYSTRKHEPGKPRLRVLLWLDRTCDAEEYEAVARKMAEYIGLELCDPTTFEPCRLMYWPSCSSNSQYVFHVMDKPFLSVDGILRLYHNWADVNEWPRVPGVDAVAKRLAARQGNPIDKKGIVGAFCRVYSVERAIEELIPDAYEACGSGRYTYLQGSTSGGAVLYDDGQFLYSHHSTDPCGGKLVNSFDLVRLHKFGAQDDEANPDTPTNRLPSYTSMTEFAFGIPEVKDQAAQDKYRSAQEDFSISPGEAFTEPENSDDWVKLLEMSERGFCSSPHNVLTILENGPMFKGKLVYDAFLQRGLILAQMPWEKVAGTTERRWTEGDDGGLATYLQRAFGIKGDAVIRNALNLFWQRNTIDRLKDYVLALPEWDGVPRLDTLLIDYLGAYDSEYNRAVSRKSIVAAIARAVDPGCKYDCMPIITGPQGIYKSSFISILGGRWFTDSIKTFDGKEAAELIQGIWFAEVAELNAFSRSETASIKQFLTQRVDQYRPAYGRNVKDCPRRCVFFGTCNEDEYLTDATGNRRFWPVDVGVQQPTKNVWKQLPSEREQIFAEAYSRYKIGEPLYMNSEQEKAAVEAQKEHKNRSPKEGPIREFLDKRVPKEWYRMTESQQRMWYSEDFKHASEVDTVERAKVCALEIWVLCFGRTAGDIKRQDATEINGILNGLDGWTKTKSPARFGHFGAQKGYEKNVNQEKVYKVYNVNQ